MENIKVKGRNCTEYPMTAQMLKLAALYPEVQFEFAPHYLQGELTGTFHTGTSPSVGISVNASVNGYDRDNVRLSIVVFASTPITCPERLSDLVNYLTRQGQQLESDIRSMPDVAYYTEEAKTDE